MIRWLLGIALVSLALASCGGGSVRRISEPTASIQQLTVRSDGRWDVQLRLQNYSSMPMRFDSTALELTFDNGSAARLDLQLAFEIGPETADVYATTITPLPAGRARIAAALADNHGLTYTLHGDLAATPEASKQKHWEIKRDSALSPVPGIPGALR